MEQGNKEDQGKGKNVVIVMLVTLVLVVTALCTLVIMNNIKLRNNEVNNSEKDNDNQTSTIFKSERESITCMDSEITINGITVKTKPKHDGGCHADSVIVNDKTIEVGENIDSYEIYDNNIIFYLNHKLVIYSLVSKSFVVELDSDDFNGYKLESYVTNDNVITITTSKCKEECGSNLDEELIAIFEIEYSKHSFSKPKLVNKYTTKDLIDSVKITDLSIEKPVASSFGGEGKNMLAVPVNFNLDCSNSELVVGVILNGYCLDTDDNKYSISGPLSIMAYYCNVDEKPSMYVNQVFDMDGIPHEVDWKPSDKWEQIDIKYCKIEKANIRIINASKIITGVDLNYEKEFK